MKEYYHVKIVKDGLLVDVLTYIITNGWDYGEFESTVDANWNHATSINEFVNFMDEDGHKLAPQKVKTIPKYFK